MSIRAFLDFFNGTPVKVLLYLTYPTPNSALCKSKAGHHLDKNKLLQVVIIDITAEEQNWHWRKGYDHAYWVYVGIEECVFVVNVNSK